MSSPSHVLGLRCRECGARYPDSPQYVCEECFGPLEVEYDYDIIKSPECVPLTHSVNANIAMVGAMSCHKDARVAYERAVDGFRFFGYSIGHHTSWGTHQPGVTNIWQQFLKAKDDIPSSSGDAGIGTPDQVRKYMRGYEDVGLDQIIFMQALGNNKHEHICESLELFSKEVMPEFQERRVAYEKRKAEELAPFIAAAMARKPRMAPLAGDAVPKFEALQRKVTAFSDRGGGIPSVMQDPRRK